MAKQENFIKLKGKVWELPSLDIYSLVVFIGIHAFASSRCLFCIKGKVIRVSPPMRRGSMMGIIMNLHLKKRISLTPLCWRASSVDC